MKKTRATTAGVPRSISRFTRGQRKAYRFIRTEFSDREIVLFAVGVARRSTRAGLSRQANRLADALYRIAICNMTEQAHKHGGTHEQG